MAVNGYRVLLTAELLTVEPVRQLLCLFDITDFSKGIIIHAAGDPDFIKHMLHELPPFNVDLYLEGEPGLELEQYLNTQAIYLT